MLLKNYTSETPAEKSIARIEYLLGRSGVTSIIKEYGAVPGEIAAITFTLRVGTRDIAVRLPANKDKCLIMLWKDYAGADPVSHDGQYVVGNSRKRRRRADFREQAERTAWKLVSEWVEVQLSMISLGQAEPLQVFLSYVWDSENGVPFYDRIRQGDFAALPAPKSA